jgi:hypothetical protein
MTLIEEMKEKVTMEIRPNSRGAEYLEAVIKRDDLEALTAILTKHLGGPAKAPGKEGVLPKKIQPIVQALGSLRIEQSFYYKEEKDEIIYVALWPWGSDPERITLKAGVAKG